MRILSVFSAAPAEAAAPWSCLPGGWEAPSWGRGMTCECWNSGHDPTSAWWISRRGCTWWSLDMRCIQRNSFQLPGVFVKLIQGVCIEKLICDLDLINRVWSIRTEPPRSRQGQKPGWCQYPFQSPHLLSSVASAVPVLFEAGAGGHYSLRSRVDKKASPGGKQQ